MDLQFVKIKFIRAISPQFIFLHTPFHQDGCLQYVFGSNVKCKKMCSCFTSVLSTVWDELCIKCQNRSVMNTEAKGPFWHCLENSKLADTLVDYLASQQTETAYLLCKNSRQRHYIICGSSVQLNGTQNLHVFEVSTQGNKTVIKGVPKQEEKKHVVRTRKTSNECPLCEFQDTLTYRDVLVLQQFLSPDGRILPRHITGMCKTMQWKLENILYQSYSAGLLPNYKPILPVNEKPEEYDKKYKWRKNNVYFEDFSIENPL